VVPRHEIEAFELTNARWIRTFSESLASILALKAEVAKGVGDGDILAWILANAPTKRSEWDIAQWSAFREAAVPCDNGSREFVDGEIAKGGGAAREDIAAWFDDLDFDDHVTFGGKA
jgi:hypothetical protein